VAGEANACGCASGPETYTWYHFDRGTFLPTVPPGGNLSCDAATLLSAAHHFDFPFGLPYPAPSLTPYPVATPYPQLVSLGTPACSDGWALVKGTAAGGPVVLLFNQGEVFSAADVDEGFKRWNPIAVSGGTDLATYPGMYAIPRSLLTALADQLGLTVGPVPTNPQDPEASP